MQQWKKNLYNINAVWFLIYIYFCLFLIKNTVGFKEEKDF